LSASLAATKKGSDIFARKRDNSVTRGGCL